MSNEEILKQFELLADQIDVKIEKETGDVELALTMCISSLRRVCLEVREQIE